MSLYSLHCSLIKMLYWMVESTDTIVTVPQLRHAIKRNFSGFPTTEKFSPFECFVEEFKELDEVIIIFSILVFIFTLTCL